MQLTQQASKCYGWRQSGKVDKDNSSHALTVQGVLEVTDILWVTALHVSYQPTEGAPAALQRVVRLFWRCEEGLCMTGERRLLIIMTASHVAWTKTCFDKTTGCSPFSSRLFGSLAISLTSCSSLLRSISLWKRATERNSSSPPISEGGSTMLQSRKLLIAFNRSCLSSAR